MEENSIRCPKCNSTQLTANKKGFSGKNAVVGGLLTGGVGLLAGTIGSDKIIITCLSCAHKFKPGEGKRTLNNEENEALYKECKRLLVNINNYSAIQYYKKVTKGTDDEAKDFLNNIITENNIPMKLIQDTKPSSENTGCFIATACYGDYEAPEVLILRKFRDNVLRKSLMGKYFIKSYYKFSPPIAIFISKYDFLKNNIRRFLIQPIVNFVDK